MSQGDTQSTPAMIAFAFQRAYEDAQQAMAYTTKSHVREILSIVRRSRERES